jgi:[glutamine synthetase] adenylyltransferase / [glutamine synthetase]-adenylyl-L-tyrosine phosphorylase
LPPKARSSAKAPTTLAHRIARNAWPAASPEARGKVEDWQREIARTAPGKTLARLIAAQPNLAALIESIADGSPYLWDLITASPRRWLALLNADPDARFAALLAEAEKAVAAGADDAAAMRALRLMKAEASLLIAVADIGAVWDVAKVTHNLTAAADTAVAAAVRYLLRGIAPKTGRGRNSPDLGSGYVVLALGKMGAYELNYSSDIDLIVLYDPASKFAAKTEPGPLFVRLTRGLVKLLQERTADGYVFRVDLRLRPDPASTQIAISLPAALGYYEHTGQNWERAAMIKARPCAGDIATGEAFLKSLSPFIWRRHLDYVALADVHAMKEQIHVYRGHGEIAVEGHNIKLGRGGIREIEFFVQTQQLIAGGRHPELRGRQTLAMLDQLAQGKWIKAKTRTELHAAYEFLRTVEHRLQMVADEQTQTLPGERDALDRFARFMGFSGRDAFGKVLLSHLGKVQRHYAALFEVPGPAAGRRLVTEPGADIGANVQYFAEHGFKQPADAAGMVQRWFAGSYRTLKSELARAHLADVLPLFIDHAVRSENPDAALAAFDRFLEALHGGARLYSLLRQNRDLVALLATILGTAPRLADILAQQPAAMDAVLDPAFFGALPDDAQLERLFTASLGEAASYEDLLDRSRLFGREHMFLIGVRVISGTVTAAQAGQAFARLADVLIRALLKATEERFAADHGRLPGQRIALLALGKLGGQEMTAGSDLDLILIYDFDPEEPMSTGARPLPASQYFARLTQRLINTLTVPTNYGRLYDVDMRLRPSGRSGPLATSLAAFEHYQNNEAWTWEHMALTRARVLAASAGFGERVQAIIGSVLAATRDPATVAGDVVEMRQAVATERGEGERWNLRDAAGGHIDIEFIAQYLQLVHGARAPQLLDTSTARVLDKAAQLGLLAPEDADVLRSAVRLVNNLTQILRLCVSAAFDPKTAGAGLLRLMARAADVPDFAALDAHVADTQLRVRASFERILQPAAATD